MERSAYYNLKIASFNMYSFNNGLSMLLNLCNDFDIILLQEHWLSNTDLSKLNQIDVNFISFGVSAMNSKSENSVLVGRPFGGTAILVNVNVLKYITLIEVDQDSGRYVGIRYCRDAVDFILINVYFPYYKSSPDYTVDCCSLIANFERIFNNFSHCSIIIAGDFNFSYCNSSIGFDLFKHVVEDYNLICCDNLNPNLKNKYTYCHNS